MRGEGRGFRGRGRGNRDDFDGERRRFDDRDEKRFDKDERRGPKKEREEKKQGGDDDFNPANNKWPDDTEESKNDKPAGEGKIHEKKEHEYDRRREDREDFKDRKFDDRRRGKFGDYKKDEVIDQEEEPEGLTFDEFKAKQIAKKSSIQKAQTRTHDNTKEKK